MKRLFDVVLSGSLLIFLSPLIVATAVAVILEDRGSPFYVGQRVARGGGTFGMVKFRSMYVDAHRTGVMSTASDDVRITRVGHIIRRFKLDEVAQLWNILIGDMSFVGPRPNVPSEVALYSDEEMDLVAVRPGVTDFASIVFSDEGDILDGSADPDRDYNLLIRPWKSRLGLHYLRHASVWLDVRVMILTGVSVLSRAAALRGVGRLLGRTGADEKLRRVSRREDELVPTLPPSVAEVDWEAHLTYGADR